MVVKGLIKSIDYNGNTCQVRLPLFESSSKSEVVLPAIISSQPGLINNYKENDVVLVAFENNSLDAPVIVGKLYLGSGKENNDARGSLAVTSLKVTKKASLPLSTQLTFDGDTSNYTAVNGGVSTYKTLADLVAALQSTEKNYAESKSTLNNQVATIKVTYLETTELPETFKPSKDDPKWSTTMPTWKDGYYIWQKTTCYNNRGLILGDPEILCLSSIAITPSYWLRCSTTSHVGKQQKENNKLEITAMVKLGTSQETIDTSAILDYAWSDGSTKLPETESSAYQLVFKNTADNPLPNADLIITAKHKGVIYEQETIMFAPLNTPVLVLSNENDSIEYDSYGFTKMDRTAFVESTASVKLNNEEVEVKSYTWSLDDCTADATVGTSSATIKIIDIDETADSATATCEAIYLDNLGNEVPLTKVFSISKVKQGRSLYKLDISNDFITIPAVDNGKGQIEIPDDFDWDYLTSHTINAYYGDDLIDFTCSMSSPAEDASEKVFHLKYIFSSTIVLEENHTIKDRTVNEVTFTLADLLGKTGSIIYELYRGKSKVATAKFEATRLDSGTPATSYWLNISSPIHVGSRQTDAITIQPKIETGNSGQDNDILAKIRCQYVGESSYIEVTRDSSTGKITLPIPLKDKNILIEASQKDDFSTIYESETITFSPLNTPVIDLTNDSAALTYTAGGLKINKEEGKEDVVESTATLYLNGKPVEGVTYSWTYTDCIIEGTTNSRTIKIKGLLAPKGTATCSVSYWGETFTKVFSITKQIQGEASTSYWLKTSCVVHTGANQEQAIEAIAMKKVGEAAEKPDGTAKLYYRYCNDENWIGGSSTLKIENYKNEDLYIVASHKESFIPNKTLEQADSDIYDWETITFSPLNTPVLDLTNDSDSLTYNAENNKIELPGQTASVTSTAALYLNGDEVSGATYSWTVEGCSTTDYTVSSNNKTITINAISEDSLNVKATCTATYNGKPYSKVFSVVKQVIATTYWLKVSHPVHVGTNQTEPIRIVAMKKEGTNAETLDNTAYLWYKYKNDTAWTKAEGSSAYVLNINNGWKDQDLTIFASHKSYTSKDFTNEKVTETSKEIYDWEVITFSPLNTPTINLTNDTASLVYNYDDTKYSNDVVSTTAELYLNGTHITDGISYEWTADENKCTFKGSTNSATIQVKEVATGSPTAKVTCKITIDANGIGPNRQFAGKTYEKKFVVVKQFKGDPTTTYELNLSHSAINLTEFNDDFIVKVGKKVGLQPVHFLKAFSAGEEGAEFIYDANGGNAGAAGREGLDLYIIAYVGPTAIAAEKVSVKDIVGYQIPTTGVSKDNSLRIELYRIGDTANSILLDSKTVTILEDGATGESVYKLEIENDFVTIPTDFEGTIHLTENQIKELTTHSIKLYYGSELQLITKYANSYSDNVITTNTGILLISNNSEGITDTGVTPSYNNSITSLTTNTGSITYDAYVGNKKVATAKFEISKVKSGEPATYYKLETDCSTIVRKQDGTTTPEIIVAKGYKYTGSTKEEVNIRLEYKLDDSTTWNAGILPVDLKTENVTKSLQLRMRFSDSQTFLDSETIPVVYDGVDGEGTDTTQVFNAFLWTTDYIMSLEDAGIAPLPSPLEEGGNDKIAALINNVSNAVHTDANAWQVVNPSLLPTKNARDLARKDWKLVYISSITATTTVAGETSYSMWTEPEVYLCKDSEAYRILTTAEGLFDYGQGIYYTYEPSVLTEEDLNGATAPTSITIKSGSTYKQGTKINNTQFEIAEWIAKGNGEAAPLNSVKNRKKVIKVYIDAEYIRAGALTVGDASNPIFQAGLDDENVIVGGFTIGPNKLSAGSGGSTIGIQSSGKIESSTPAEYILSTGSQCLDTGIKYNAETAYKLVAKIAFSTLAPTNQILGFGGNAGHGIGTANQNWWEFSEAGPITADTKYDIEWTLQGSAYSRTINGNAKAGNNATTSIPDSNTLKLFATQTSFSDSTLAYYQYMKLYECKIYVNGNLVKNYIPVQKNGIYGLVNTIDNTFLTDAQHAFLGHLKEDESAYITKNGKTYRRVSYIQNNGKNYIDTDVLLSYDEGFTIEAEYTPAATTNETARCCIISNYAGNTPDDNAISCEIEKNSSRFYFSLGDWDNLIKIGTDKIYKSTFSYNNNTALHGVDGETINTFNQTVTGNVGSSPLRIFCDKAANEDSTIGRFNIFSVPLKLYSLKISKGSAVARYYVPVVDELTNTAGLLDLITGTFLNPAGEGTFTYVEAAPTAGVVFKINNDTYTTLSYLKSTGTQYINTGVKDTNKTSIEIEHELITPHSSYGTTTGLNYTSSNQYPGGYFYYYNQHSAAAAGAPIVTNKRMIVKQDRNKCYRNGTLVHTFTETTFTENCPILLFGRNGSTSGTSLADAGTVKIYYCKIWENGELIRDFVPVLKNGADYGMFDRVNNSFYANAGTGVFTGEGIASYEFNSIYLGSDNELTAPFRVTNTGKLTATNADISGTINANSGKIGGFSLTSTEFKTIRPDESTSSGTATDVLITNANQDYWSKVASQEGTNWRLLVGSNFGVDSSGKLCCADACVNGTINATAGSLKGIKDIETLNFSSTEAYSTNLGSDTFTTRTLTTSGATIAGIKIDSTSTSDVKDKDTQKVTIQLDPGIVSVDASTSSFKDGIASYIGGSWIFYLKFKTTGGEKFTSQRIFTGYRVDWAVFQSDSKKTTGSGSSISSEYITTKVYFNNAAIYTSPGYDYISMSNTGGGNGASPSAKWRLVQVSLKKYSSTDTTGTGSFNTLTQTYSSSNAGRYETVNAVDIKANQTITSSYLRITGGLYPNKTDAGESSSFNIGDANNKWDNMYSDKVYATTFYASSDKRLKENIKDYVPKNSILNLPVVEFDFKESGTHQIGCIAQDLQEICPELVSKNENGYLSISENKLVYLLLLELKKLNTKVINLEQQLENERNN